MATAAQTNERLAALLEAGTSPWLDQIKRSLIEQGELERLIREDSLRGVTSNPAIFEKAILGSDEYDEEIERLAGEGLDANDIYLALAIQDVQAACDVMRPVWEEAGGADGFVSLEVEPGVAFDTDATLRQANELWERVDRPNVMIKIPATDEGMPAIEDAIAAGINVNVTLLFKVEAYEKVAERFIAGLERRHEAGESLDVHSVASFFVSRVDSEVDKRLDKLGREDLKGKAALANARDAYMSFKRIFQGERFATLREAGAPVQRPLWASTGVKNPEYSETMYVDGLVAPDTVNTMPMATLNAVAEKGEISGATADEDPAEVLKELDDAGIDMADVTDFLLKDGVEKFVVPFDKLIAGVESVKEAIVTGRPPTIDSTLPDELEPPIAKRAELAVEEGVARRIWRKDETLWGGPGPEIGDRLGWLTISEPMLEHASEVMEFAQKAKSEGYTHVALLGMGGSSLGPEVIRRSYGDAGRPRAARARLDRPRRRAGARKQAPAGQDGLRRVLEVRWDRGDAVAHEALLRAHRRQREAVRGRDRPRQPVDRGGREARLRRVFQNDPEHRRPLFGPLVLRPGAGRVRGSGHRRAARDLARGRGELQLLRLDAFELRAVAGPDRGRAGPPGARQAHLRRRRADLELRPLGRAADRRVHGQARQGHPARWPTSRWATPTSTATTA